MNGYTETITVVRPGPRDRHGDPVTDNAGKPIHVTEHTIDQVIVAPAASTEDVGRGETVTSGWDLYVPPGADIAVTDRVRRTTDPAPGGSVDLKRRGPWVVVTEPAPWRSPFSNWAPGTVVRIERHSG